MFNNSFSQPFSKPEGEEKKKKRNKKSKKISPEMSEESNPSLNNSRNDLTAATSAESSLEAAPSTNSLLDIVAEINNVPAVEESAPEPVQTQYEELPVEESTMQTIIESINQQVTPVVESAWEQMLSGPNETEAAWESEVSAAPQSADSVWDEMLTAPEPTSEPTAEPVIESVWEQMLSGPDDVPSVDNDKEKIMSEFGLAEITYDLIKEFFNDQEDAGLLKNDLLRYLLINALGQRIELQNITEEDVNNALSSIDTNHDDKINFDEFIQLLSLFFSSKNNLKQRINSVLSNLSSTHEKSGFLTNIEADSFTQFLDQFYGRKELESEERDSENFLTRLVKKILNRNKNSDQSSENEIIDYLAYATEAADDLQELCFVKF